MKKIILGTVLISLFALCGCSLKYVETPNVDDVVPEFVFENTTMTSYQKNKKKTVVNAETLEQYKNSTESYAKGLEFTAFDDKGKVSSEGQCDYLFADTKKETYQLSDNITLKNHSDNINFYADALKYDGKTEQLTSGKSDTVKIEKDNTVIHGSGFSASGVSKTYRFTGAVSGEIEEGTKEEK